MSVFQHHGAWWLYGRQAGRAVRLRVGRDVQTAVARASEWSLTQREAAPSVPTGSPLGSKLPPIAITELRRRFLEDHEFVRRSAPATLARYRTATHHLEAFCQSTGSGADSASISGLMFVRYLHDLQVAPNGHPHSRRRALSEQGKRYILETCGSMFAFGVQQHLLAPEAKHVFLEACRRLRPADDAKPIFIFDADSELQFLRAADAWAFGVHFVLAKLGLRTAELTHLLVADVDFERGWIEIANKPHLGWRVKTGRIRRIPLVPEVEQVLRRVIGQRTAGPVFLSEQWTMQASQQEPPAFDAVLARQTVASKARGRSAAEARHRATQRAWQAAGAVRSDRIRSSFITTAARAGLPPITCPKSWRHTLATLLQDAGVDPLIRQALLGHAASGSRGPLGTTALYTHTRWETLQREDFRALRLWPQSLALARNWAQGGAQ